MTMLECLMLDFQKIMSWKLWINYDSRHVQRRMDRRQKKQVLSYAKQHFTPYASAIKQNFSLYFGQVT